MTENKRDVKDVIREMFGDRDSEVARLLCEIFEIVETASSTPPQGEPLIQGYTAEQWQEIIDGGYLCEFHSPGSDQSQFGLLKEVCNKTELPLFTCTDYSDWENCRPAQLKGVMRPIFVEPVDKINTACHFFDSTGTRVAFGSWDIAIEAATLTTATKYIEV